MGAGGCALLLLWCLASCGLADSGDGRSRRDVHRIIIREQVGGRARGPQHHHRAPPPVRGHGDGRHRAPHDSYEFSDEYERTPAESSKKYKKLPPQSSEFEEETFASDWKPVLSKSTYYYPPVYPPVKAVTRKPTTLAPLKREKPRTKATPKPSLPIHESIDITTVFPPKKANAPPSVYKGNLKRLNHMNYFNYKITPGGESLATAESKQKENVELPRRRPVKKQTQPKKADGGYQVHEDVEGDIKPPRYTSFNALSPSLMKSVPLYPAFEDNQIVDIPKVANKTGNAESFGKRTKGRRSNKSSSQ